MRRSIHFLLMLVMTFFALSLVLYHAAPVLAIGEVTPTPTNEDDTEEAIDPEELLNEALIDLQNGDFEDVIEKMEQVIEVDSSNALAFIVRGIAHIQLEDHDEAIDDFSVAIDLEPWQMDSYLFRANAYALVGDNERALSDYDEAIYISPFQANAYLARSEVYYNMNDDIAAETDELIADALMSLSSGDSEQSIDYLEDAIEISDDQPVTGVAYYILGILASQEGDNEQAFEDYTSAIELDERLHNSYLGRGILNRIEGNIEAAGQDFFQRMQIHGVETIENAMEIGDTIEVEMAYRRVVAIEFDGERGQEITITADDTADTVVDPLITLLDPDGNPVAGDDDFGGALNSLIDDFELPQDGTYTLLVSHAEGGYTSGFDGIIEVQIRD